MERNMFRIRINLKTRLENSLYHNSTESILAYQELYFKNTYRTTNPIYVIQHSDKIETILSTYCFNKQHDRNYNVYTPCS